MKKAIKVVMVEPSKHPTITTINKDLESLQQAVGGLIEFVGLEENTCILCNEEGKLIGLDGNRRFYNDIIVGTFYVCGLVDDGDLDSLTPSQMDRYLRMFWEPESFTQEEIDNSIVFKFIELD